jgi:hypothetical protein
MLLAAPAVFFLSRAWTKQLPGRKPLAVEEEKKAAILDGIAALEIES